MISPTNSIATLWVVWLLGWVITSRATAKTVVGQSGASQLSYSLFIWIGAVLLFFHPGSLGIVVRPLIPNRPWIRWLGVALVALGLTFAAWARFHLGRLWSGTVTLKEDHTIVKSGPYRLVRHPIYTGLVLAFAGTALANGTAAALAGIILLVFGVVIKLRQEERLLTDRFGAAYEDYRKAVRTLMPYIW